MPQTPLPTFKTNGQYQRHRRNSGASLIRAIDTAILQYARSEGTTIEFAVRDALTDMRHICDIHQLDFESIDSRAMDGYGEEIGYWKEIANVA